MNQRALHRRAFLALTTIAACSQRTSERCALCGMTVPASSRWRAGATVDGRAVVFDAPRCLFQYRASAGHGPVRDPWVIEYYGPTERRTPATEVRFVPGSRQRGPMGPDVVPVAPAMVERFRRDHGGREPLAFEAVNAAVIDAL